MYRNTNKVVNHKKRFLSIMITMQVALVVGFAGIIGVKYQFLTHAATGINIKGRVTKDGRGVADVYIDGCELNVQVYGVMAITDADGNFSSINPAQVSGPYCVRVFWTDYTNSNPVAVQHNKSVLGNVSWPPTTTNNPASALGRYEYQLAGVASGNGYDLASDTNFTFTFSSAPVIQPTPAPSPTPSKTTTTKPSTSSKTGTSTAKPAPAAAPDVSPPSAPSGFAASKDDNHKTVVLNWQASSDAVGVTGYSLERSSDGQNWETVDENISGVTYEDISASFGSKIYYRVRAFDAAGNKSDYASTDITTDSFDANVQSDTDASVSTEDGAITVNIPAGTFDQNVMCDVRQSSTILGPTNPNYEQIAGPYELICRDKTGTQVTTFAKPLTFTVQQTKLPVSKTAKLSYFGQKGQDWQQLKVTSRDKKNHIDSVALGDHTVFSIAKARKHTSIWMILFWIFLIIALIVGAVLLVLRFNMRRKLKNQYDDYLHKSRGY